MDLQINGYAGLDFNRHPVPAARLSRAIQRAGVTSYFATVITNAPETIGKLVRAAGRDGAAGIHLEGPFISPEDGARGAHDRAHVRPPDWNLFCRWQEAAAGRIRIVTLSPDWPVAVRFIEKCAASGVTVSIGHTSATPAQIRAAVAAGARMSTHLGNGVPPVLPRHPNCIWEQLAEDRLAACVIADGFHLPDSVLKVVMRVKGAGTMLVSDAVHLAGMRPGRYAAPVGGRVVLTKTGRLHLEENPKLLAGSARMLPDAVDHLVSGGLCNLAEAWEMASTRPAAFMGLPQGAGLAPGAPADFVTFDRPARIRAVWKSGRPVA